MNRFYVSEYVTNRGVVGEQISYCLMDRERGRCVEHFEAASSAYAECEKRNLAGAPT